MDLLRTLERPGSILLDSSAGGSSRSYLFSDPVSTVSARSPSDIPGMLRSLDEVLSRGMHAAGYLAYESGYGLEPHRFVDQLETDFESRLGYPLAWFGLYSDRLELDEKELDAVFETVDVSDVSLRLTLDEPRAAYESKIERIRALIHDGDVYQVNFTARFEGRTDAEAVVLYALMRRRQPVSFGAFLQLGSVQLLSASPELFIQWSESVISARPMKGTVRRGATSECDALLGEWLKTDPKSRAENLMIVDLLRNDLSHVSEPGSVSVPHLFAIETYPTVTQMTSAVTGRLEVGQAASDIISALFPCGSVTGAPKIRAMRRILELESQPRGIYCGAIGCLEPGGAGAFNVAIRTLSCRHGSVSLGSGGGIVWESKPAEEYEECVLKSRFLTTDSVGEVPPIELIETMRWENGIALCDHHLARLERSAKMLGYPFPAAVISARLDELWKTLRGDAACVVRMLLGPDGRIRIETRDLPSTAAGPYRVGIAATRIASANPFLGIKSTFRDVYDAGRTEAAERGLDELLYFNERGELTEGTITNVFLKLDGKWVTPPLSSGVLPGIGRSMVLSSSRRPTERVLREADLRRAEEILLTNAVRGEVDALLESPAAAISG